MPPPSSGGITLANILNQIENLDFNNIGYHSSLHVHYLVEAEKANGRWAMIGFIAAIGAYLTTGQIIPGIF